MIDNGVVCTVIRKEDVQYFGILLIRNAPSKRKLGAVNVTSFEMIGAITSQVEKRNDKTINSMIVPPKLSYQ